MRRFVRLMAGAVAAASVTALAMASVAIAPAAMADPPPGQTVHNFDLSGIGSDTTESLFNQFTQDYNAGQAAAHKKDSASNSFLYSWDATNPTTQAIGDSIVLKKGCAAVPRPDGSSAGIVALTTLNKSDGTVGTGASKRTTFCIDFVRSARNRSATDPCVHPAVGLWHQDLVPGRDRHSQRRLTAHLRERRSHQEESSRRAAAERGHQRPAQQGQAGRDLPVLGRQVPGRGLPLG